MRYLWWILFGALLLQMILNPCMRAELGVHTLFFVLLNSLVVVAIIVRYWHRWFHRLACIALSIPIIAIYWLPWVPFDWLTLAASTGLLYLYAIFAGIPLLLRVRDIGVTELAGACSLYLLIGLTWAHLYLVFEIVDPGSFVVSDLHNPDGVLDISDFIYYSFTTLTTLGYGDIAPVSCQARSLAILEAVSGLFLLSFVIARLISLHAARIIERSRR